MVVSSFVNGHEQGPDIGGAAFESALWQVFNLWSNGSSQARSFSNRLLILPNNQ